MTASNIRRTFLSAGLLACAALTLPLAMPAVAQSLLPGLPTLATQAVAQTPASAPAGVVFNEISQRVNPDWIEFYNRGATPVDLSGWKFQDDMNRGTEDYVFPAGTIIQPRAFLVLDGDVPGGFSFGLGAADLVRLSDSQGNLVDSFSWSAHGLTTYGRCPDGTGEFRLTAAPTKGTANDCTSPVRINEIESNGGNPGDWIELINPGTAAADISGHIIRDNDDSHTWVAPAGTVVPAGGFLIVEEASLNFGLGGPDSVRFFAPSGELIDSYAWTTHATTTYGRCPDGMGAFENTVSPTKSTANACEAIPGQETIKLNEIESNGGTPGDWVELINTGGRAVDIGGWLLRDDNDGRFSAIPSGTVLQPGGFYVHEEAQLGFGLGVDDIVRLYTPSDTLVDAYAWGPHAATTYGRCPNGTGEFVTTAQSTKGAVNACAGDPEPPLPWPGSQEVATVDLPGAFTGDLSGLDYQATGAGVLWAVNNGNSHLYRLVWDGAAWVSDTANDWSNGKALRYPDGTGTPDSEGVTVTGNGSIVVATERNNVASGVSRLSLLRFDPAATGTTLTAVGEWNLTSVLPPTGANTGFEAVEWVPDTALTAAGFVDESTGRAYNPADYRGHDGGVYFVGVEATGIVYGFVLIDGGAFQRVATITPDLAGVMALDYDLATGILWAVCDDGCLGRSALLKIDSTGAFAAVDYVDRPAGMPNLNNEGFAITPLALCVNGSRPVYWSDDADTGGFSLRVGALACSMP